MEKKKEKPNWFDFSIYFDKNHNFQTKKKDDIKQKIKSIVSYFTYRFDYDIYPELKVNISFQNNEKNLESGEHLNVTFKSDGNFHDLKIGKKGPGIVYVATEIQNENMMIRFPFKRTEKNNAILKHKAICKIVALNPKAKHFFFMDVNTAPQSGVYDFATEVFPKLVSQYSFDYSKKTKILIKFGLYWKVDIKPGGQDFFVNAVLNYIDYIRNLTNQECEFYCILESDQRVLKTDKQNRFLFPKTLKIKNIDSFEKFVMKNKEYQNNEKFIVQENRRNKNPPLKIFKLLYNHILNKNGKIIKYVFGMNDSKEGLDLFTTSFVHFLKPPESISVFKQASARAARFCSFARYYPKHEIPHVYTPIIYYDVSSTNNKSKELIDKEKIENDIQSPTEKILDLFQENSIDCNLHSKRTNTKCAKKSFKFNQLTKLCISPYNASRKKYQLFPNYRSCYTRGFIPSSNIFTEWHFALYTLLKKNETKAKLLDGNIVSNFKQVTSDIIIHKYFKKNNITLNGFVSSLQYIYYIFLIDKENEKKKKYFEAIYYILQEEYRKLKPQTVKIFDDNNTLQNIIQILFEKGKKLERIQNYPNLPNEISNKLNTIPIDRIFTKYNNILKKRKKLGIHKKLATSSLRSGKTYKKELGNLRIRR